jgi:riboflavin kinase/FMN adenylyltransferase
MTPHDRHIDALEQVPDKLRGCVLTIGNFDGVHRGHRRLLDRARELSQRDGSSAVVMTFEPPPELVLHPDRVSERISTPDERTRLLVEAGADCVVTVPVDRALLDMTPQQFIEEIIIARFFPSHIVEGPNFHFGRGRGGSAELLQSELGSLGIDVHIVEPLMTEIDEQPARVCSTLIRELIKSGRVELAAELLERPFALTGEIVSGVGIGRTLKFPTANIDPGRQVLPGDGVYAAEASVGAQRMAAAVSIGNRPTFDGTDRRVEAFLLGADGNLYEKTLTLRFINRIRDQEKFSGPEELRSQIEKDVIRVREIVKID